MQNSNNSQGNMPIVKSWAQLAKNAMTDKDKTTVSQAEAKMKAEVAEKRKKDRDAYLDRQAKRVLRAKEKEEYDNQRYKLFSTHMYILYGAGWMYRFDERGSKSGDIPRGLFDRVQKEIEEDEKEQWERECEYEMRVRECNMVTKSWNTISKESNKFLDEEFSYSCCEDWNRKRAAEKGKIWIEEKINEGIIREIFEGIYEYYPPPVKS